MVVARQHQHAAVRGRARRVGMLEDVHRPVHARPLAVPHAEHAVALRARKQVELLRAPDRGGRQVFVHAGLENDVAGLEMALGFPQRLVQPAQR
ncbi:hypothetical protein D3C72_1162280 [compost metagenome]